MLILGTAECAAQRSVQLVVLDKTLHFIHRHLLVLPLFLEVGLAFINILVLRKSEWEEDQRGGAEFLLVQHPCASLCHGVHPVCT